MLIHLSMRVASAFIVLSIERYLGDLGGLPSSHQIHSWEFRGHRPFCDTADYIPWPHGPTTMPRGVGTMHRKYKYFGQARFHAATPPFALPPDRREARGAKDLLAVIIFLSNTCIRQLRNHVSSNSSLFLRIIRYYRGITRLIHVMWEAPFIYSITPCF